MLVGIDTTMLLIIIYYQYIFNSMYIKKIIISYQIFTAIYQLL